MGAEPEGAPNEERGLVWKKQLRHRQRRAHHNQWHRRRVETEPDKMGQHEISESTQRTGSH